MTGNFENPVPEVYNQIPLEQRSEIVTRRYTVGAEVCDTFIKVVETRDKSRIANSMKTLAYFKGLIETEAIEAAADGRETDSKCLDRLSRVVMSVANLEFFKCFD